MPPCIHPKHKRKKTIYVALILTLKLAGNDGFHFAHHGHLVETAIVTRLLSSDTSDPTEQARLPHVTMPHPHPKSSTFIPVAQRRPLPITITNPNERDADQPKPHQPLPITITNNSLAYKIIIPPCIQRDITAMPPKSSFTVSTVSPDCSKSDQPENPGHSPTDHTSQSEEIEEESRKDTAIFSNNVTPILPITNNSLAYNIIMPPCIQRDITAMPPKSSFTVSTVSPDCSKSDQPENPGHSPTDHTSQSEEIEEESRKDTAIFSNNVTPILHKRSTHHDRLRPLIHA
jgi:hypothetical protein